MTTSPDQVSTPATADRLLRLAALVLGPHGNADHIVASVLARDDAESEWHRFAGEITRDEWRYTLTVRACREWLDGYAPSEVWTRAREAEHHWDEPGHAIDLTSLRSELNDGRAIDAALAHMTDPDRAAVVLCDALGMSVEECGAICRTQRDVTTMHLRRGRKTLLEALSGDTETVTCRRPQCGPDHDLVFAEAEGTGDSQAVDVHCRECPACATLRAGCAALRSALAAHVPGQLADARGGRGYSRT